MIVSEGIIDSGKYLIRCTNTKTGKQASRIISLKEAQDYQGGSIIGKIINELREELNHD